MRDSVLSGRAKESVDGLSIHPHPRGGHAGGVTFWGWLMVGLGLISDLTAHAQAYTNRQQAMSLYQQPAA